jgi:hypothetical protein
MPAAADRGPSAVEPASVVAARQLAVEAHERRWTRRAGRATGAGAVRGAALRDALDAGPSLAVRPIDVLEDP